jgi:hypothetical protein
MEVAYLNSAKCCNILNILDSLLNNQQWGEYSTEL